jgi:hypothetical protein
VLFFERKWQLRGNTRATEGQSGGHYRPRYRSRFCSRGADVVVNNVDRATAKEAASLGSKSPGN